MGFGTRACHDIFDHTTEVVALVGVDERVVDAHVGVTADEDQRVGVEPAEQNLEVGPEEARIPALGDDVVVWDRVPRCGVSR
jgi:hypothetical protein